MQPQITSPDRSRSGGAVSTATLAAAGDRVDTRPVRQGRLAERCSTIGARERLEEALQAIAVDLLGPDESGNLPGASATWVATRTGAAVSQVCDSAIEGLVEALEAMLIDMPPEVARQLQRTRQRREAGFR